MWTLLEEDAAEGLDFLLGGAIGGDDGAAGCLAGVFGTHPGSTICHPLEQPA